MNIHWRRLVACREHSNSPARTHMSARLSTESELTTGGIKVTLAAWAAHTVSATRHPVR